jgi:hypothetical protein
MRIATHSWLFALAAAIAQIPCAFSQDQDAAALRAALKKLQEVQANASARASNKAAAPAEAPTAQDTRAGEELLNNIGRQAVITQRVITDAGTPKVIYGVDDRRNYDNPEVSANERMAADSTAILVDATNVSYSPDHRTVNLRSGNIIDAKTGAGLCTDVQASQLGQPQEPFYDEPNPGFCSGFRVSKDRFATAGHCIRTAADCAATRIVFGFYHSPVKAHPERGILAANVYSCKGIVDGNEDARGADWRIIELDRDIVVGTDVILRSRTVNPPLRVDDKLTVIGYPLGLPVKIAKDGAVRSLGSGFFVSELDTYEGNSGSAVFNSARLASGQLLVEGILVRGENDFAIKRPCFISKRCPHHGCRGEDVTVASALAAVSK